MFGVVVLLLLCVLIFLTSSSPINGNQPFSHSYFQNSLFFSASRLIPLFYTHTSTYLFKIVLLHPIVWPFHPCYLCAWNQRLDDGHQLLLFVSVLSTKPIFSFLIWGLIASELGCELIQSATPKQNVWIGMHAIIQI